MQTNAAVLTVVCVLLCLAFNYTFPLIHRDIKRHLIDTSGNRSYQYFHINRDNILNRTKNMANNIETVMKKIKSSAQDLYHINQDKNNLSNFSHYEQLVIMKKYPYLDIKELNSKYIPLSNKNERQSDNLNSGGSFGRDPSLCDAEDGINVEINNRGLSGFFIPFKYVINRTENKLKLSDLNNDELKIEPKIDKAKKASKRDVLHSLKYEILAYKIKSLTK